MTNLPNPDFSCSKIQVNSRSLAYPMNQGLNISSSSGEMMQNLYPPNRLQYDDISERPNYEEKGV
jgi:hypothetical protein